MKKKDYLYMGLLVSIPLFLIAICMNEHEIFGHSVDWFNQHVILSDALRHTIRKEGTLFPTYISSLMGGVNIYHFSYYGYLRPDVILGALFINIKMIDIIIAYQIFLMMLTGISCYLFLKEHYQNKEICLFVSFLMMLSALFYQSHKQIMFVNYMPFFFLGMLSIDYYFKHYRTLPFVICGILIVLHSYYYCLGCFFICSIYFIYRLYTDDRLFIKELFPLFISFIEIILCTAILTIPTLYVIMNNSKNVSTNVIPLFSYQLKGLLYNPYGCGLTYLVWILLILGLSVKKIRILSWITFIAMTCPIVSYIFNGFLYARSKILIVFIPLVAYIICEVLEKVIMKELKWAYWQMILIFLPLFFIEKTLYIVIDMMICFLILIISSHFYQSYFLYLIIPFFVVYQNNQFLNKEIVEDYLNQNQIIERYQDSISRLACLKNSHQNVNNCYGTNITRASGYTSTNHTLYNSFLYDTLKIPMNQNNRVSHEDSAHIFYLGLMSIDTIISDKQHAVGYSLQEQQKQYKLYQNHQVMPIAYASHDLYSEKSFKKLSFPYNLDILYNHVIVGDKQSHDQSQFIDEKIETKSSYHIHQNKKKKMTIPIKRTTQNEILVIEFDIKNNQIQNSIDITINGMKNKLSAINHPYYNNNTHFTYVLSDNKVIEQLTITLSEGDYQIDNIHFSSLDYDVIKNRYHEVDQLNIKSSQSVLEGDIHVRQDGYFVTNIPYEKGYTIYIDQQKVEPEIVNTAFLGCQINKGYHKIKITFQPPGYILSLYISILGLCLIILHFIYERTTIYEKRIETIYELCHCGNINNNC